MQLLGCPIIIIPFVFHRSVRLVILCVCSIGSRHISTHIYQTGILRVPVRHASGWSHDLTAVWSTSLVRSRNHPESHTSVIQFNSIQLKAFLTKSTVCSVIICNRFLSISLKVFNSLKLFLAFSAMWLWNLFAKIFAKPLHIISDRTVKSYLMYSLISLQTSNLSYGLRWWHTASKDIVACHLSRAPGFRWREDSSGVPTKPPTWVSWSHRYRFPWYLARSGLAITHHLI